MKSQQWPRYASPRERLSLAKNLTASAAGLRKIFGAERVAAELEEFARLVYSSDSKTESAWGRLKPPLGRPKSSGTAEKMFLAGAIAAAAEVVSKKRDYDLVRKVLKVKKGHDRQLVQRVPENAIALFKLLAEIQFRNSKTILSRKPASS